MFPWEFSKLFIEAIFQNIHSFFKSGSLFYRSQDERLRQVWPQLASLKLTIWKVSVFGVFLDFISPHSDWIWKDTLGLSIQSECGKIGSKNLWIRTLFTQWRVPLTLEINTLFTWPFITLNSSQVSRALYSKFEGPILKQQGENHLFKMLQMIRINKTEFVVLLISLDQ